MAVEFLETPEGRRIAYHRTAGKGPGVVFLGGFKSDMEGSKAVHLEGWAKRSGRAFLRFDYSGHGQSGGDFTDGCIGDWAADARAVIEALTEGPQVLVGSSMGGWISLLMTQALPARVAGLVTIAAAPDFTEAGFWASFNEAERRQVMEEGQIAVPSEYGEPYIITRRLIEDGRDHLVMDKPLPLPFPVRCLQGTADTAVSTETALALLEHAACEDMRLTLVKGADHSFSSPPCLVLIEKTIEKVLNRAGEG
ncbi:Alpha/beta hydrolase family protein [Pseudoruegeria aquimaris]|uniref:Palmitoyl-protein thioesterase ABHD10, mitochondrial n=1 Tax=Pseudoruegeria aquimaris TaxID=393663 RepID=A0A1Y5RGW9_9RHOB|nr:alpha/beta hydrolase [Pseudoruegeria aquimaris]SLN17114.1 Alpha/beta hydrolase family protein [Pseudoruegeria aquimaris]